MTARRWAKTGATQQRILDAATEAFATRGFAATTMADVVAGSGASVGSIYHHFGGKSELFLAIFEQMADAVDRRIDAAMRHAGGPEDGRRVFELHVRAYLEAMWENRRLAGVLTSGDTPPGFDASRRYPVVYMADGVFRAEDFPVVERQILDKTIPPVVLVGVWPGLDPKDALLRSKEYLLGWPGGAAQFAKSERFLIDEVLTLAENRYGASSDPRDRLITGYSSGAAWAVSMAVRNPAVFGQSAAFSLGWSGAEKGVGQPGQPRLFLSAGSFESTYYKATLALAEKARRSGGEVVVRRLVSDHDNAAWQPMLVEALKWALGGRAAA